MRADEFITEDKVNEIALGALLPTAGRAIAGTAAGAGGAIKNALTGPTAQKIGANVLSFGKDFLKGLGGAALSGLTKIGQPQVNNAMIVLDGQPLVIDLNNSQQRTALENLLKTFK